MAFLTWMLPLLCVAGSRPSSASPVPLTAQVYQTGQDARLPCNLTSDMVTTWYLLRSDQLLPLLTVSPSKVGEALLDFHAADRSRVKVVEVNQFNRSDDLVILGVQEEDAGLYFCTSRGKGAVNVSRGVHLAVGAQDESDTLPCWSLGICVLPALLVLCVAIIVVSFLCSGKPAACCCDSGPKVSEDASLHYSSLKHAGKPRPFGRGGTGLAEEDVTYSTVAGRKEPNRSHDRR